MANAQVGILMGSSGDLGIMQECANTLKSLGIPFEIEVSSAHRTPARTAAFASSARSRGLRVIIAGAGAAAHLAGVVAAHTTLPVIGVPIDATAMQGLDALLSTVQMPGGIPVATMAIGKAGAKNAALFAAEILAVADADLAARLDALREDMAAAVEEQSRKVKEELGG